MWTTDEFGPILLVFVVVRAGFSRLLLIRTQYKEWLVTSRWPTFLASRFAFPSARARHPISL